MWKIPIGIGNFSLAYLYMLGPVAFKLLQDYLLILKGIKKYFKKNIFGIETVLNNHSLISDLYGYISYIIFGSLFFYLSNNGVNNNKKGKILQKTLKPSERNLIFNQIRTKTRVKIEFIIICILFALNYIMRTIISYYKISGLDFWIFNIVFISFFMYKYFRIHIYKHHKYSLGFIFITNLCLLSIAATLKKMRRILHQKLYFRDMDGNAYL